jgi:hypothetical protein
LLAKNLRFSVADPTTKSICNVCGRETDHDILWSHSSEEDGPNGEVLETRTLAVRCRGCGDCTIRKETWFFSGIPEPGTKNELVSLAYSPPRLWRRPPAWIENISEIDPDLKGMLDEIYSATNSEQVRLLSMGVRSALDHAMTRILEGDFGPFEVKLDEMVKRGHLTQKQRENLAIVIDAGSASTHRNFRPPQQLLEEMLTVMEAVIREHYITGPMLATAKTLIPPRPPRSGRS